MERRKILEGEWSPKNKGKLADFSFYSGKKVWWKCNKANCEHHEWEATISNRMNGTNCPFCVGQKVCPCNSLEKLRPDIAAEWHPKNKIKPSEVRPYSNKKIWWKCNKAKCDHHVWEVSVAKRLLGENCPFCSGHRVCPCNSLKKLRPDLAAEWHPKNKIKPSEVSVKSNKKVWWKCTKANCEHHEWEVSVAKRTEGTNCPFCAGQKVCPCNSLEKLRPDLAAEWHPKNKIKPSEVSLNSGKKVWWKCNKANCEHHEWETVIYIRSSGSTCPFCSGHRVCPCNSLEKLRPDLAAEWHPKNKIKPSEVSLGSGKKIWWKCNKEHEWEASIFHRIYGTNCPICRIFKGEKAIKEYLENKNINFIPQKRLDYKRLSFDFFLPDYNVAVEFDGIQHFEPVDFFGGQEQFEKQTLRDLCKNYYCFERGLKLLRIHHLDVDEIEPLLEYIIEKSNSTPLLLSGSYHSN